MEYIKLVHNVHSYSLKFGSLYIMFTVHTCYQSVCYVDSPYIMLSVVVLC